MALTGFTVHPLRMMDERWKPSPNRCLIARDVTWDCRDGIRDSGGFREIVADIVDPKGDHSAFVGEGPIISLHWFAQHNGARSWLIWEDANGRLRAYNGSNAPTTPWDNLEDNQGTEWDGVNLTRTVLDTPWQRTQSQAWGGRLYFVNGYDEPIVFDGIKTERAGFDAPAPAPSAIAMTTGTTLDELGLGVRAVTGGGDVKYAYRYKMSFLNERGQESPLSPASEIIIGENQEPAAGATGARRFNHVNLATGGPNIVARRLYRTANLMDEDGEFISPGEGDNYYFHSEIEDNFLTSLEDGTPDSALGSLADELDFGPWPATAKFLASFKGAMFIAGMTSNELRYSAFGYPEVFPEDNVIPIGDDDMGPITGIYPMANALVVFKPQGIYLVKGGPQSGGFEAQTLTRDEGTTAPNSIKVIPGLGLVFLSERGLRLLQGTLNEGISETNTVDLSAPIPDRVKRISSSALHNASSAVYHRDKEYWVAVPTIGGPNPTEVWVYHYEIGEWSFRPNFPISCMLETRDHKGHLLFGSHSQAVHQEGVFVYSRGWETKGGTDVETRYETVDLDFGSVFEFFNPRHVYVYCIGYGNNDLELNYRQNRDIVEVRATADTKDQQDPNLVFDVYGTGLWGTARWSKHRPIVLRYDVYAGHKGPIREFRFALSPTGRRMQLVQYDLVGDAGSKRNMKPINKELGPVGR